MKEKNRKILNQIFLLAGILFILASTLLLYFGIDDYMRASASGTEPRLISCSVLGIVFATVAIVFLIVGHINSPSVAITVKDLSEGIAKQILVETPSTPIKKTCISCGTANDEDSNFCKNCGSPF